MNLKQAKLLVQAVALDLGHPMVNALALFETGGACAAEESGPPASTVPRPAPASVKPMRGKK